jgi:hypothetical protein
MAHERTQGYALTGLDRTVLAATINRSEFLTRAGAAAGVLALGQIPRAQARPHDPDGIEVAAYYFPQFHPDPRNPTAEVRVPADGPTRVTLDGRVVWDDSHGHGAHVDGDRIVLEGIGGGRHAIRSRPLTSSGGG